MYSTRARSLSSKANSSVARSRESTPYHHPARLRLGLTLPRSYLCSPVVPWVRLINGLRLQCCMKAGSPSLDALDWVTCRRGPAAVVG